MAANAVKGREIAPAKGKLGVLLPGMGAVATTFVAGVEAIRTGLSKPVGSLTQMGTVRLGKRTDNRNPRIDELVPHRRPRRHRLRRLGHLHRQRLRGREEGGRAEQRAPGRAQALPGDDQALAGGLRFRLREEAHGENVKKGKNKRDLADQVSADIERFKKEKGLSRLVMVWCGSTEVYREAGDVHSTIEKFEKGLEESHPDILPSMIYAYAAIKDGIPYANGAPNLSADFPALVALAKKTGTPIGGKDFKTGQTLMKTILAPGFKARLLGPRRLVLDEHPRQPRRRGAGRPGVVQDARRSASSACSSTSCSRSSIPTSTARSTTWSASTTTRRAATTRRAGTTSTSSAGWATRCRSRSTSSAATRSWPRPSCSTSRSSSTSRAAPGMSGIQEWLSFYFKSPQTAPGLYPEHDLFIQLMKLKNTLRHLRGRGADHAPRPRVLRLDRRHHGDDRAGRSGVKLKEVATAGHTHYQNCTVLHSDAIGLVFEVQRTVAEGGTIENVVSQVLVPWAQIQYVLLMEERT